MTILAIDTSGPSAGVALMRDATIVYSVRRKAGVTHSETIMPMVSQALDAESLAPKDIDLFACVVGPGSFTGVRIGVCAVKGMAEAVKKPVCAVDALEALAYSHKGFPGVIAPVLDARRGQVYGAAFRFVEGERPERLFDDTALAFEDFLQKLPEGEKVLFTGDAVSSKGEWLLEKASGCDASLACASARDIDPAAVCALAALSEKIDGLSLEPLYLRLPQAERERNERSSKNA